MEVVYTGRNYMHETTVVETKQGIYIEELLYKWIQWDTIITSFKVVYIPQGRNRSRRGRGCRAMQSTTTTVHSPQGHFTQTTESMVTPSAQASLLQAMENLNIRPQYPNGKSSRQGLQRNNRPEFTPSSRARHGAIPRPANNKVLRSSKTTVIKNGPRTTYSSVQTAMYQSGRNTTVRTGEAVVTRDLRAPPAMQTSVFTGGSQVSWTAPPAWHY